MTNLKARIGIEPKLNDFKRFLDKLTDNVCDHLLAVLMNLTLFQAAYPIDTVRRRMMMTSAEKVKYRGGIDCISAIVRSEGVKSLYRGAGVNVVRGVAGAGVLSGFDKFKNLYIGWRVKL